MADRHSVPGEEGETRFGTDRPSIRGALYIESGSKTGAAGNPAALLLDSCDTNGAIKTWALWVDSGGTLRIVEAGASAIASVISTENSSGTVVGSQS